MTDTEINIAISEALGSERRNYTGDLNAIHAAESTLESSDNHKVSAYFEALHKVVGVLSDNPQWAMIHATARQRAEAFLKTLGKWQE